MVGDARAARGVGWGESGGAVDQAGGTQAYAYDLASRLRSLTVGAASSATFTFDALGRIKTRTTSSTETYAYLGTSETAWASATSTSTRASVIGLDGSRIATRDGVTTAYLVPDPHGNVAATETATTAIANAIRYDGYGQTLGTPYVATGAPR